MTTVLERLRGGVIVSCQAYPGEPMRVPDVMTRMAQAAVAGGALGIRAQGPDDVRGIRAAVSSPLIGLWKDRTDDVVITPTLRHALRIADEGADIVALDATNRARPDGRSVADTVREVHERTSALVMADISTYDEGLAAVDAGADVVSTTLSGYTGYSAPGPEPDLALVADLVTRLDTPVVAEGRIHTPDQVTDALNAGAYAVVVGTAITHPTTITRWFVDATG